MSAAELRKAAETLRERAAVVEPGPWERADNHHGVVVRAGSNWPTGDDDAVTGVEGYELALYVATMHPGVGRVLGDLLDTVAGALEAGGNETAQVAVDARSIARLINGGAS